MELGIRHGPLDYVGRTPPGGGGGRGPSLDQFFHICQSTCGENAARQRVVVLALLVLLVLLVRKKTPVVPVVVVVVVGVLQPLE